MHGMICLVREPDARFHPIPRIGLAGAFSYKAFDVEFPTDLQWVLPR